MWRVDRSSVSGESQDRSVLDVDDKYRFVDDAVTFAPTRRFTAIIRRCATLTYTQENITRLTGSYEGSVMFLANREQVLESTFTLPICTCDDLTTYLLLYKLPIERRTNRAPVHLLRSARFSVYNFVIIFE